MKRMFYVAMTTGRTDRASASCVDDQATKIGKQIVKEFFRDYAGREIRHVDGDEMKRLMTAE